MATEQPISFELGANKTRVEISPKASLDQLVTQAQKDGLPKQQVSEMASKFYDAKFKQLNPDIELPENEYLLNKAKRLSELGATQKDWGTDLEGKLNQFNQFSQEASDRMTLGLAPTLKKAIGMPDSQALDQRLAALKAKQALSQGIDPTELLQGAEYNHGAHLGGAFLGTLGAAKGLEPLGQYGMVGVQSGVENLGRVLRGETHPLAALTDFGIDMAGARFLPGSSRIRNLFTQGGIGAASGAASSAINQALNTGKITLRDLMQQAGLGAVMQGAMGLAGYKPTREEMLKNYPMQGGNQGGYPQLRGSVTKDSVYRGPMPIEQIPQQTGPIRQSGRPIGLRGVNRMGVDEPVVDLGMSQGAVAERQAVAQDMVDRIRNGQEQLAKQRLQALLTRSQPEQSMQGPMTRPMDSPNTGEYHGQPKAFEAAIEAHKQEQVKAQMEAKAQRRQEITDKFTNPVMELVLQGRDTAAELKLQQLKAVLKSKTATPEAKEIVADTIDYINQFKAEVRAQRKADARAGRKADTAGNEPRPQAEPTGQTDELGQLVDTLSPPETRPVETPQTPEPVASSEAARVQPANALPGFELIANHPVVQSRPDLIEALNSGKPIEGFHNSERTGSRDESSVGRIFDMPYEFGVDKAGEPFVRTINENGQFTKRYLDSADSRFGKIQASDKPFPYTTDRNGIYAKTGETGKMRVLDAQGNEVVQGSTGYQKTSDSLKDLTAVGLKGVRSAIRKGKNVSVAEVKGAVEKARSALDTITTETLGSDSSFRTLDTKARGKKVEEATPTQRRKIHKDVTGKDC